MGWLDTITGALGSDLGQTLVGVGGDLASAYLGSQSSQDAAQAYANTLAQGQAATDEAINRARGDVLGTVPASLEDLMTGFQGAINTLESPGEVESQLLALSGGAGPEAEQAAIDAFMESPGQQFAREQGEQTILRNSAATGGLGGNRLKQALMQFGIGTASQNLQNRFNNLGSLVAPETTRATNIANLLQSGGTQLANFRSGIGTQLGNFAMGGLAQQIPLYADAARAQASGVLGQGNAMQTGISNISNTLGQLYGNV